MSKLNLLFSVLFVFAVSGCVDTSTFGNKVSETSSDTVIEGSNGTKQSDTLKPLPKAMKSQHLKP